MDSVLAGTKETPDFKILLDPLERQLYVPPSFADASNLLGVHAVSRRGHFDLQN